MFVSKYHFMAIQVGQSAPDFTLYDSDKNKVTLSELKGKNILLLFFPLAFTGVCTKELCSVRDSLSFYNNTNAHVMGISIDSPMSLSAFKKEQNLNFPLLSDFNKTAATAFECIYDTFVLDMKGVAKRSAFIIDKEGTVKYAEVLESAGDLPNFEAIHQCLNSLN